MNADDRAMRIARQHAMTSKLLGVDFLPVRVALSNSPDRGTGVPPVSNERDAQPEQDGVLSRSPLRPEEAAVRSRGSSESSSENPRIAAAGQESPEGATQQRPAHTTSTDDSARAAKSALLAALRIKHDNECPHCTKATAHTQTVWGDGDPDARLMIIGEAPGADEDREGIPFVGRSGQLLNQMITAMGLSRDGLGEKGVYIANVLKARPPNNDTPTGEEAAKCGPYLREQVRIIAPRAIVTMGNPATQFMLETKQGITSLRGRWQEYQGIPLMPTFHPAYLLRNYTPENCKLVWSDLKNVMGKLGE